MTAGAGVCSGVNSTPARGVPAGWTVTPGPIHIRGHEVAPTMWPSSSTVTVVDMAARELVNSVGVGAFIDHHSPYRSAPS